MKQTVYSKETNRQAEKQTDETALSKQVTQPSPISTKGRGGGPGGGIEGRGGRIRRGWRLTQPSKHEVEEGKEWHDFYFP